MCLHPVISAEKMCFSIFLRFACKFRLKMTPINHLLMNYLRVWLSWKRLRPIWKRLEGTSGVYWNRLMWRGLLRNRLLRGLLWCRLVWRLVMRTSRALLSLLSLPLFRLGWLALPSVLLSGFAEDGTAGPSIILE